MTPEDRFEEELISVRKFLREKDRRQLLVIRRTVDEILGYKEFIEKVRAEGIVIDGR